MNNNNETRKIINLKLRNYNDQYLTNELYIDNIETIYENLENINTLNNIEEIKDELISLINQIKKYKVVLSNESIILDKKIFRLIDINTKFFK